MLPKSFENSAKGVPQGYFAVGSKVKSVPKPHHIVANFMLISYLKPFCAAGLDSPTVNYYVRATFALKKHAIQQEIGRAHV